MSASLCHSDEHQLRRRGIDLGAHAAQFVDVDARAAFHQRLELMLVADDLVLGQQQLAGRVVDAERQRAAELDAVLHFGERTEFHRALRCCGGEPRVARLSRSDPAPVARAPDPTGSRRRYRCRGLAT
jgi:hypothetical protein